MLASVDFPLGLFRYNDLRNFALPIDNDMTFANSVNPKVAVVLPVYNTERYLSECLTSLFGQTYKNFKIFAVNDGSTDSSGKILSDQSQKDKRLIVINKENGGASSARNAALDKIFEKADFDYICFVDSDDIVSPIFIEKFVNNMADGGYDYCVCGVEHFNTEKISKTGVVSHGKVELDRLSAIKHYCQIGEWSKGVSNICMTSRCFKSSLIGDQRFDLTLSSSEDQDFILKVLLRLNKGLIIPDVLYRYRQRASSLSHSGSQTSLESSLKFAKTLLTIGGTYFPDEVRQGLELKACDSWWQVARKLYISGTKADRKRARAFYYFLKQSCSIEKLPKKYKKRFFIFSLGDWAVSLYFRLNHREKKIERMFE